MFESSRLHQLALSKAVEQIGELCGRIVRKFPDFASAHSELDLIPAYMMRNKLAHGYNDILIRVVIDTVKKDVPALRRAIEAILADAAPPHA